MKSNSMILLWALVPLFLLFAGCTSSVPFRDTAVDKMHDTLQNAINNNRAIANASGSKVPAAISAALIPETPLLPHAATAKDQDKRFDLSVNNMDARVFFMGLVEGTNLNMIMDPQVTGKISLNLKSVTIEDVLSVVRDIYGYEPRHTTYGFEVLPKTLQTRMFVVDYLDVMRAGKSVTQINPSQISDKVSDSSSATTGAAATPTSSSQSTSGAGSSVDTRSKMDFWKDLTATLTSLVSDKDGRSIVVNAQTGVVVVKAYPSELREVARYLAQLQSRAGRQVILEAKILEVELTDGYQAGIDWSALAGNIAQTGNDVLASNTVFPGISNSSIFTVNITGGFEALINLLQTQGNVQVLSSPRISTVNNQKAVIKVGQDEFFVTNVSTSSNIVGNTTTVPTQNVTLTPFFSGITLDVTPQISNENNVILHVHPSVTTVKDQNKTIELGTTANNTSNTLVLPLALSSIRESDSIVEAQNGQVVVIGGLMQTKMQEGVAGVPGASKIPFVGAFFRSTKQTSIKSELVILLRPIVANARTWTEDLEQADQNITSLKRGFHLGGASDVFGVEGERAN